MPVHTIRVNFRWPETDMMRWKQEADQLGVSMSELVRRRMNATETVLISHPPKVPLKPGAQVVLPENLSTVEVVHTIMPTEKPPVHTTEKPVCTIPPQPCENPKCACPKCVKWRNKYVYGRT